MKEFQKMVGKKLLWVGSDSNDAEESDTTYLLFEDNTGVAIDMVAGECHELTEAKETLAQLLKDKISEMKSFQTLEKILTEGKKDGGVEDGSVSTDDSPDKGTVEVMVTEGSDSQSPA